MAGTFPSLVIRAAGTNCGEETVVALERAGSSARMEHMNVVARDPGIIDDQALIVFAGGFTYGDDVASGAVFAHSLRVRLQEQLNAFVESGRFVLGICNGFQVLTRLGLLPGTGGKVALVDNLSGRYEDRWVRLRAGETRGPWFEPGQEYYFPVAHAEGRFEWFPDKEGEPFPESQVALRYLGNSEPAEYPANPNGSAGDIAGITNPAGNVLGLMPHPERFLMPTQHPCWTKFRGEDGSVPAAEDLPVPLGLQMFERVVQAG